MTPRRGLPLITCAVVGLAGIPLILRKIGPNAFYGFRTPFTQSSPDIWYPANAFLGWSFLIAALVGAAMTMLSPEGFAARPWSPLVLVVMPIALAVAVSLVYLQTLH